VFGVTPISPPGFEIFPTLLGASVIITVKLAFVKIYCYKDVYNTAVCL
jgi:hypothetical protein